MTHILFYSGKEASERWTALKDQVDQTKLDDADTVFKAFANSFEKSSSQWQAKDEYLSDIEQTKHQTTAELDIYIKDLIRKCQFPQEQQESCKIDLFHATAHFEVRKFIHNAKQEELKYDRMIEVAKAHERTCQEYQIHKQALSMAPPSNYSNPLIQASTLAKSFQKGPPPKKTCGKCRCSHNHRECPTHSTTCSKCGFQNHWAQQCRSSWRRNSSTGHSPSLEGRRIDNSNSAASMTIKSGDMEEASSSSGLLPTRNQAMTGDKEESHSRLPPPTVMDFLPGPAHPPKVTALETRL